MKKVKVHYEYEKKRRGILQHQCESRKLLKYFLKMTMMIIVNVMLLHIIDKRLVDV